MKRGLSVSTSVPEISSEGWIGGRIAWLLVVPIMLGSLIGLFVSGLSWLFESQLLDRLIGSASPWTALVLLAALPLSVLSMRFVAGTLTPSTNEFYIIHSNVDDGRRMPLRQIPGRVLAGGVTVACGGAQGMESPSASLGAGIGILFERFFGRSLAPRERGLLMKAGASAAIATIFSSPGVGAVYGMEVSYRRGFDARPIVQATLAAVAAFTVRYLTVGLDPLIPFVDVNVHLDSRLVWTALLLALVCGFSARAFASIANLARGWRKRVRPWIGVATGSLALASIAICVWFWTGSWLTLGTGHAMFDWAMDTPRAILMLLAMLLLHAAATIICVFGGGGGGVVTSLAATGALVGCITSSLMGTPDELFLPLVGAACLLSAAYRIPIAGMLLIVEWGGGMESALLGLVCIAVSQSCMGRITIAPAQVDAPGAPEPERP
ncbi:MAG: hypothetical protein CMJ24_10635 [Phycisphaerae bacterium]|nr:hypothetical protein [Phycisphaerae bacterium]